MISKFWGHFVVIICLSLSGCRSSEQNEVILFCALDREFSQQRLEEFEKQTKIHPVPKFDAESSKTVGLANLILKQGRKGNTDLFWNNEILHTLRIQKAGLTLPLPKEVLDDFPKQFQGKNGEWVGFGARARVLIVNTKLLPDKDKRPNSLDDLVNPKYRGKACMAKPLFGTTATHMAVLCEKWGLEKTTKFLSKIKENKVAILSGNRQVAADVATGLYPFGITDTDDALVEIANGSPVAIVFPDQKKEEAGSLLIPNTVAILASSKNRQQAEQLVHFIVSPENESALATGGSGQIPLGKKCQTTSKALKAAGIKKGDLKWMKVDWDKTVDCWEKILPVLSKKFL